MATTTTHLPTPSATGRRSIVAVVVAVIVAIAAAVTIAGLDSTTTTAPTSAPVSERTVDHATGTATAARELAALREVARVTPSVGPALVERMTTLELVITGRLPVEAATGATASDPTA